MLLLHDNKVIQKIPRRCIQSDSDFYVAQTKFIERLSLPDEEITIKGELKRLLY